MARTNGHAAGLQAGTVFKTRPLLDCAASRALPRVLTLRFHCSRESEDVRRREERPRSRDRDDRRGSRDRYAGHDWIGFVIKVALWCLLAQSGTCLPAAMNVLARVTGTMIVEATTTDGK